MSSLTQILTTCRENTPLVSIASSQAEASSTNPNETLLSAMGSQFVQMADSKWPLLLPKEFTGLVKLFGQTLQMADCIQGSVATERERALNSYRDLLDFLDPLEPEANPPKQVDWSLIADVAPQMLLERVEEILSAADFGKINSVLSKERLISLIRDSIVWDKFLVEKLTNFEELSPEIQWALLYCLKADVEYHETNSFSYSDEVKAAFQEAISTDYLEEFKLGEESSLNHAILLMMEVGLEFDYYIIRGDMLEEAEKNEEMVAKIEEVATEIKALREVEAYGDPLNEVAIRQSRDMERILLHLYKTAGSASVDCEEKDERQQDILDVVYEIRLARMQAQVETGNYEFWEEEIITDLNDAPSCMDGDPIV